LFCTTTYINASLSSVKKKKKTKKTKDLENILLLLTVTDQNKTYKLEQKKKIPYEPSFVIMNSKKVSSYFLLLKNKKKTNQV